MASAQADLSKINLTPSQQALQNALQSIPTPLAGFGIYPQKPPLAFSDYRSVVNYYGLENNFETFLGTLMRISKPALSVTAQRLEKDTAPSDKTLGPLASPDLMKIFHTTPKANDFMKPAERFEDSVARVKSWLTPDMLGNPELNKIFTDSPPLFLVFSQQAMGVFGPNYFGSNLGFQITGSNVIFLNTNAEFQGAPRDLIVLHETLHYLTFTGHQNLMYWDGAKRPAKMQPGFLEGMNHYFATQIFLDNNPGGDERLALQKFSENFYPEQTKAIGLLAKIVGRDTLQKAFFSGDFTEVKNKFEAQGGDFEKFLFFFDNIGKTIFDLERMLVPSKT